MPTLGSIESTDQEKRVFAARSMDFNIKDPVFRKLFPTIVKNYIHNNSSVRSDVSQQSVVEEGDDGDESIEKDALLQEKLRNTTKNLAISNQNNAIDVNNTQNKVENNPNNDNNLGPKLFMLAALTVVLIGVILAYAS